MCGFGAVVPGATAGRREPQPVAASATTTPITDSRFTPPILAVGCLSLGNEP